jgi:hypothetical protein
LAASLIEVWMRPERSRASCSVKLPVIIARPWVMGTRMVGAEITSLSHLQTSIRTVSRTSTSHRCSLFDVFFGALHPGAATGTHRKETSQRKNEHNVVKGRLLRLGEFEGGESPPHDAWQVFRGPSFGQEIHRPGFPKVLIDPT